MVTSLVCRIVQMTLPLVAGFLQNDEVIVYVAIARWNVCDKVSSCRTKGCLCSLIRGCKCRVVIPT